MANTFFDFETSLNNGENILPPDEETTAWKNEEEYDALNDETFGTLEDSSNLEDWEQQHEQFAEIAESSKHSEQIENSISQLVLDNLSDHITVSSSVWSYTPASKNGETFNSEILSSLQKASKSFITSHSDNTKSNASILQQLNKSAPPMTISQPKKNLYSRGIREEPNKNPQLQQQPKQLQTKPLMPPPAGHHQGPMYHPMVQHPIQNTRLPPPGLQPMGIPPPGMRPMPPHMNHHHHPMLPSLMRMMPPHPHFMANGPQRPPGFMYPPGAGQNQFPRKHFITIMTKLFSIDPKVNHPFNFPPPPRNLGNVHPNMQQRNVHSLQNSPHGHQQQRTRYDSGSYRQQQKERDEIRDEYAGLMSLREKQWLLNIQMLQLNTGTPYFDDYYYTVFKEKKSKSNKENLGDRNTSYPNNKRQHRNSDRQENQNTLTPRVYTPLQFENSLGKLQCGSVTAPRKIIDMDIVTPDKDTDSPQVARDTRRTKQVLLKLEALYALLLKAEDIRNPLYISNVEKLREIKQKQRLRELEMAPTPEQKQEILRLFKLESEPIVENQYDYIIKIIQGLLQEEKFSSFLNIRKGKMLILRLLPYLTTDTFGPQLLELWSRVLLSLPIVGRRDTAGDNILPKLFPFFKRYIQSSTMTDVLDIIAGLVEVVKQENNRINLLVNLNNQELTVYPFGVSALVVLLIRTEFLISSDSASEKQQNAWSNFLQSWSQQTEAVAKVASPLELIPSQIFIKHCNRFNNLKSDKRSLLEKHFVDSNN
ncbi:hypothetical protein NQ317_008207 [Molorchus minor]|uniref:PAT1-like protein 1 n=1 Tax=Molorchus minor TaxID=1323400 RepID=A0ABQ9JX44_9CUCU|nr:hypothetical protein NQ317_008207 [Molorchus minor]